MKRRDYEMFIKVEVETVGLVSDFGRGMEIGAISMLERIIELDIDLEEQDKACLLREVERARAIIIEKSKEVQCKYESKGI